MFPSPRLRKYQIMNKRVHMVLGRSLYWALLPVRRAYRSNKTRAYGLIEHENKVLVVKNWIGSGVWSLPGGGGHAYESYEDTLARELHEETGINIDKTKVKLLIKGEHNREFGRKKFVIFHVPQDKSPHVLINHLEIVESKWVDKNKLDEVSPASYELQRVTSKLR